MEEAVDHAKADAVIIALPQSCTRRPLSGPCGRPACPLRKASGRRHDGARVVYEATQKHPDQVVMVNQNFRWRSHIQSLRRASGRARRPYRHICLSADSRSAARRWVRGVKNVGALPLDFAIHHFDLIRYLTGDEVTRVIGLSFRPPGAGSRTTRGECDPYPARRRRRGLRGHHGVPGVGNAPRGFDHGYREKGLCIWTGNLRSPSTARGKSVPSPRSRSRRRTGIPLTEFLRRSREATAETHVGEHVRSLALSLAVMESHGEGPGRGRGVLGFLT